MKKTAKTFLGVALAISLLSGCSLTDNLQSAMGMRKSTGGTEQTETSSSQQTTASTPEPAVSAARKLDDYIDTTRSSSSTDDKYLRNYITIDPGEKLVNALGSTISLEDIGKVESFAMTSDIGEDIKESQSKNTDNDSAYVSYSTSYRANPYKELFVNISKLGRSNYVYITYQYRTKSKEECVNGIPIVLDYLKSLTDIDLSESSGVAKLIENYNGSDEQYMSYTATNSDTLDSIELTLSQYHWDSMDDSFSVKGVLSVQM